MSATIPRLLLCYQAWKRGKDTPRGFASRLYESQVGKPKRRRAIFLWGSYNSAVEAIGPDALVAQLWTSRSDDEIRIDYATTPTATLTAQPYTETDVGGVGHRAIQPHHADSIRGGSNNTIH